MKSYIGTKTIEAEPMTLSEWRKIDPKIHPADEQDQDGYLVVYPDGYKSWSPKAVFEETYDELVVGRNVGPSTLLSIPVFPSGILSVGVVPDPDYGGAHQYQFQNSLGFNEGQAQYHESFQKIKFVQKNLDGTMSPGIQSEQLLIALIDRHKKLNAKFGSREGSLAITKMEEALQWLEARVRERMQRNVMGDLKK